MRRRAQTTPLYRAAPPGLFFRQFFKTVASTSPTFARSWFNGTSLAAIGAGALLFWGPPLLLHSRIAPGEHFHLAIALFAVLIPAALFFAWRAWFDAPTRADRLGRWVRLALVGPYVGSVAVGAATFFLGSEFSQWSSNPRTPAASGLILPLALVTVRPCLMMLKFSLVATGPAVLILTIFIPRGAHRPLDPQF